MTRPVSVNSPWSTLHTAGSANTVAETGLQQRSQEIADICGVAVPYEVDFESILTLAEALHFLDHLACHNLNKALRAICVDEPGRQAVRARLKRVRLRNVVYAARSRIVFSNGVLEMHCVFEQGAAGVPDDDALRRVLLAVL